MGERGAIAFEPFVEFPEHPFDAARVYLGVLAYPELGAGLPGNVGSTFTESLWKYYVWQRRRAKGLRDVRQVFSNGDFSPPRLREFQGKIERGRKRIMRRFAAYDVIGNQMVNGILNSGFKAQEAVDKGWTEDPYAGEPGDQIRPFKLEIVRRATPSKHEIIGRNAERYAQRMGLNQTGPSSDEYQKVRDLVARGFNQSRSVLHLAHGLNMVVSKAEETFQYFSEADWLLVFLWNADEWVWDAIRSAISWRRVSENNHYIDIRMSQMIELALPKSKQENALLMD